jgi:hypothetical protein
MMQKLRLVAFPCLFTAMADRIQDSRTKLGLYQRWDEILLLFLPAGYPHSVTEDYAPYDYFHGVIYVGSE